MFYLLSFQLRCLYLYVSFSGDKIRHSNKPAPGRSGASIIKEMTHGKEMHCNFEYIYMYIYWECNQSKCACKTISSWCTELCHPPSTCSGMVLNSKRSICTDFFFLSMNLADLEGISKRVCGCTLLCLSHRILRCSLCPF